ncbi:MAG: hypothetical protein CVU21_11035 [Betaproteobacteria bacterium HGW-Betaproteobacteria-15]|nr:MAG: hypothetical protein CVU21_11035 [Betaproteobacteria bacterium HGW-Betaproteobacteria-15]
MSETKVSIWDRETISVKLDEFPKVRLRWFELDLPSSVEKFSDWRQHRRGNEDDPQKRNFHAYLFGDVMPYQVHPDPSCRPESILRSFQENSTTRVTLIHGEGGQGKSRLMVEVAGYAERSGWNVLMLSSTAREDLLDAVGKLVGDSPTLLLMDYAEKCISLAPIFERLRTLNERQDCQIALVLTSRTTTPIEGTVLDDGSVTKLHISSNKLDQAQIIKQMLGEELDDLADKCMNIPVFAAFIRLLHDRRQQHSLDELRREEDFHTWIRKHVVGQAANKLALAKLCSLLPCSDSIMAQACELDPTVASYRDSMLADGWVIYSPGANSESWQVAHDLIADGALVDAMTGATTANHRANEVLKFACDTQSCAQCIQALNRISDEPCIASVEWQSLFTAKASEWLPFLYEIACGSLVPKEHLLSMMQSMEVNMNHLNESQQIRSALGLIVKDAALRKRPISETETQWVERLVQISSVTESVSLISYWLRSDNCNIKANEAAIAWVREHSTLEQAGYLYSGWLSSGRPLHAISAQLNTWLVHYNSTPIAILPIVAWLNYLKENNVKTNPDDYFAEDSSIGSVVDRWLVAEVRYKSRVAGRLYVAWINAMEDVESFAKKTMIWLEHHREEVVAVHVLAALLWHGKPTEKVREHLVAWLAKPANVTNWSARLVYMIWLRKGGDHSLVREPMLDWLATKGPVDRMPFAATLEGGKMVLTAWLEWIGECDSVEPFVVQWLRSNQQQLDDNAHFFFLSWLTARGDHRVIKEQLIEWLRRLPGTLFAEQEGVLSAWLRSEGMDRDDAEPFVRRWCENQDNACSDRADFLVANWRVAGGTAEVVHNAIEQRAKISGMPKDLYFARAPRVKGQAADLVILSERIKSTDRPALFLDEVKRKILAAEQQTRIELDHLLRRWIERMGREGIIVLRVEFLQWVIVLNKFSQAPFALAEMLGVEDLGEIGRRVEMLAIDELRMKTHRANLLYIFRGWVRSGRKLADILDLLKDWLSEGDVIRNIKCAEILQALQASEFGQQEWALQAINQFTEMHGGEAFDN